MRARRVTAWLLLTAVGAAALIALAAYDAGCGTASAVVLNRSRLPIQEIRLINTPSARRDDQTVRTVWRGTIRVSSVEIHLRNLVQGRLHMEVTFGDGTVSSSDPSSGETSVVQLLPMEFLFVIKRGEIEQVGWFAPLSPDTDPDGSLVAWFFTSGHLGRSVACMVRDRELLS